MRSPYLFLTLAAVLAAAPGLASADATASVRLTHFGYSLIDLNPGDGIAPAVSFGALNHGAGVRARVTEQFSLCCGNVYREESWRSDFSFFPDIGRSASLSGADASALLSGDIHTHDFSAVVEGRARNERGDGLFFTEFIAGAQPASGYALSNSHAITLTPFTRLVWTGQLSLDAQKTGFRPGLRYEWATADVGLELHSESAGIVDAFHAEIRTPRGGPGGISESYDLSLSFSNAGAAPAFGFLRADMGIWGQTYLPVPEAGTPWLMLCGLGVLALARRRRQARRAWPALVALAGLATAPAQADIQTWSRVTNFGYTLIDLNPGDGIAPGIEFSVQPGLGSGGSRVEAEFWRRDPRLDPGGHTFTGSELKTDGLRMFTPMAASVGIAPGIEALARMEGAVTDHSFLFEAQGRMRNEAAGGSAYQGSAYQAITQPADDPWSGTTMFRLTPFTRVVWSGDYAMRAQTTLGRFADSNEIATAALTVQAADPWSGEAFDGFFRNLELVQTEPGLLTDGGSLSVSFANETAAPALGNLYVRVAAFGSVQEALGPNAPPVPEAGAWAMWLCGLGVIGAAARSRRRAMAGG